MKKWIEKGSPQLPEWLETKYRFKKELTRVDSPASYERMVVKWGINYIISPPQVAKLLATIEVEDSIIERVTFLGKKLKTSKLMIK
jgi:hypothetical protein